MNYFSENELDAYLDRNVFNEQEDGLFVEVGAFDGITNNHTFFFEKHREWKGICIDASSEAVVKLGKNRKSEIVEACVNDNPEGFWLDNGRFSGLLAQYDRNRIATSYLYLKQDTICAIPSISLTKILHEKNKTEIDLCIISAMGSEINVLNSIDTKEIDISVIVVDTGKYKSDYIYIWMKKRGYRLIKVTNNEEVYINTN
jgi:hypothetical protein